MNPLMIQKNHLPRVGVTLNPIPHEWGLWRPQKDEIIHSISSPTVYSNLNPRKNRILGSVWTPDDVNGSYFWYRFDIFAVNLCIHALEVQDQTDPKCE